MSNPVQTIDTITATNNNNPSHDDGFHMVEAPNEDTFVDEPPGCCEQALDYNRLPDACTNDTREELLIQRQQRKKDEFDNRNWLQRFLERERNLIIACIVLAVCLNFTEGRYILYPFMIFSTWIHEMCHGIAAIMMGGFVSKLQIFKDGSGLAYTSVNSDWKRGFVASGGYPGTSFTGCFLLLFRRTTLGPTIGTIGIGILVLLSCILWVRNVWGFCVLFLEGLALVLLGWKLPAHFLDFLFSLLGATCCMNAVESIHDLFAVGDYYVGGEVVTTSDAHTVSDKWGLDYRFWAHLWLWTSLALTVAGIIFAFDARRNRLLRGFKASEKKQIEGTSNHHGVVDAEAVPVGYYTSDGQHYLYNSHQQQQPQQQQFANASVVSSQMNTPVAGQESGPQKAVIDAAPQLKQKRNWLGFLKKKKQYHDATIY